MSLKTGDRIGKYVVRGLIAQGGMAEVYLCHVQGPEGFEKEVAVKRIRPELAVDGEFVRMFVAEARLASRLSHPNLVQIFDFDRHEDTFYLAMEFVAGRSLWEIRHAARAAMRSMSPVMAAHICCEVARGLHYAHRATDGGQPMRLVHRDVTPHNVLVSYAGAVKLADFGIAKQGNAHTVPGMLKGKFAYMSPEQARGESLDARSDVFSLGIVLWELLTGGRLFEADSDVALLRAVQSSVIAPAARLNPEVPQALSEIVGKALQRDLSARYASAQEFERALARFLLTHTRDVDDTDVAGYLRLLFAEASSVGASGPVSAPVVPPAGPSEAPMVAVSGSPSPSMSTAPAPASASGAPRPDELENVTGQTSQAVADGGAVDSYSPERLQGERTDGEKAPLSQRSQDGSVDSFTGSLDGPTLVRARGTDAGVGAPEVAEAGSVREVSSPSGGAVRFALLFVALAVLSLGGLFWMKSRTELGAGPERLGLLSSDGGAAAQEASAASVVPGGTQLIPVVDAGVSAEAGDAGVSGLVEGGRERAAPSDVDAGVPQLAPARGVLIVTVIPWGHLYVDGKKLAEVREQPRSFDLAPGPHSVAITNGSRTKAKRVRLEAGQDFVLNVDLRPEASGER